MKKLSVIIPVYNVEKYLYKSIDSILAQTYEDIEVILINDGSTDNSLKICNEYAKRDDRVNVININNGGQSKARNTGIKEATGKYLMFCDSDDEYDLNMVSKMLEHINTKDTKLVVCGIERVDQKLNKSYLSEFNGDNMLKKEEVLLNIGNDNFLFYSLCNKIYDLHLIKKYNINTIFFSSTYKEKVLEIIKNNNCNN